jgi:hypothetical protein
MMKNILYFLSPVILAASVLVAQTEVVWMNTIAQTTLPSGPTTYLEGVASSGEQDATISVAESQPGLRFQLYTVPSNLDVNQPYLLQETSVGVFPTGRLEIDTEDPYNKEPDTDESPNVTYENPTFSSAANMPRTNPNGVGRRTRADRPFRIYSSTEGILTGPTDPVEVKSINFYRLIKVGTEGSVSVPQPGVSEVGSPLSPITTSGVREHFPSPASLGSNPRKYIGVEQYSLWSLAGNLDSNMPGQKLGSVKVEIYPLSDGTISGIAMNDTVRFSMPTLRLNYRDVYPGPTNSAVYAQIYKGEQRDTVGVIVPGSHINNSSLILGNYTELVNTGDLDRVIDSDGRWTIELLSATPFGVERMRTPSGQPASVTFTVDRTIEANASVTTIE